MFPQPPCEVEWQCGVPARVKDVLIHHETGALRLRIYADADLADSSRPPPDKDRQGNDSILDIDWAPTPCTQAKSGKTRDVSTFRKFIRLWCNCSSLSSSSSSFYAQTLGSFLSLHPCTQNLASRQDVCCWVKGFGGKQKHLTHRTSNGKQHKAEKNTNHWGTSPSPPPNPGLAFPCKACAAPNLPKMSYISSAEILYGRLRMKRLRHTSGGSRMFARARADMVRGEAVGLGERDS